MTCYSASEPHVSIAVITYNHANWIRQCLEGIGTQQTSFAFDVCIGDDGSSDGTTEICAQYAASSDLGYSVAHEVRNRQDVTRKQYEAVFMPNVVQTLQMCRGKYVAIIEGDDYWSSPVKLELQVRFLEDHPEYVMSIHNATIDSERAAEQNQLWIDPMKYPDYATDRDFSVTDWPRVLFPSCSVVVRREIVQLLANGQLAFGPAWDSTILYLAGTQGKIRFFSRPMGCYRLHQAACWNGPLAGDRYETMLRFSARLLQHLPSTTAEVRNWLQTLFDYNWICVANNCSSSTEFHNRINRMFPKGTAELHSNAWLAQTSANAVLKHLDQTNQLRDSTSYRIGRQVVEIARTPMRGIRWLRNSVGL